MATHADMVPLPPVPAQERPCLRSTRARWTAWRRCPRSERLAFLAAVTLIPLMAVSVRVFDFRRLGRWMRPSAGRRTTAVEQFAAIEEAVGAVARVGRHGPYAGNCLSRSLALWWLLDRRGVEAKLCLGVRMEEGRLTAHAWIECGGRVLNDAIDVASRFSLLTPASLSYVTASSASRKFVTWR